MRARVPTVRTSESSSAFSIARSRSSSFRAARRRRSSAARSTSASMRTFSASSLVSSLRTDTSVWLRPSRGPSPPPSVAAAAASRRACAAACSTSFDSRRSRASALRDCCSTSSTDLTRAVIRSANAGEAQTSSQRKAKSATLCATPRLRYGAPASAAAAPLSAGGSFAARSHGWLASACDIATKRASRSTFAARSTTARRRISGHVAALRSMSRFHCATPGRFISPSSRSRSARRLSRRDDRRAAASASAVVAAASSKCRSIAMCT